MVTFTEDQFALMHIGIKRRSGRYPWGSGNNPQQRSRSFKKYMDDMRAQGLSQKEIAEGLTAYANRNGEKPYIKVTTNDVRDAIAISTEYVWAENQAHAYRLSEKGYRPREIAKIMGMNPSQESTVRGWLAQPLGLKADSIASVAKVLRDAILGDKPFLDVGKGEHLYMGIPETKFRRALAMLKDEGYNVWLVKTPQVGMSGNQMTTLKVLTKADWDQARQAVVRGELKVLGAQSDDGGHTWTHPASMPVSVSSKNIQVRYKEDGGDTMDGVIEVRRGVPALDLGANRYAQVRVAVDGTHYMKGMAMYADDLPDGIDIRYNSSKPKVNADGKRMTKLDGMKEMNLDDAGNVDPRNPWGAQTRPHTYLDKSGKEHTSPLNIINEEGRWDDWSKTLSSQMLSKQSLSLASRQLTEARKQREEELATIMALTNPVVKKRMLDEFAEAADADAAHLKAAPMRGQSTHVILPMNSMRPNEIYARQYENGTRVALVRHPHGGPFEIPELIVNNKNLTARRILEDATDAVGIHHTVAQKLSGADFDGDTVLVIPNDAGHVKSRPSLLGLKDFDPKEHYKIPDGDTTIKKMTKKNTQTEMGKISNLITDMTIHKANDDEIARAVRHSMVVIDAEKHKLNYKQSELDNNIAELKSKYQVGKRRGFEGASTLISRASADARVPQQRPRRVYEDGPIDPKTGLPTKIKTPGPIDPKTGEKVFVKTGETWQKPVTKTDKATGEKVVVGYKTVQKLTKGEQMDFVKDAFELSSGTPMEKVYAMHANSMKALANSARKESVNLKMPSISKDAQHYYAKEVASLNSKLKVAHKNAPYERRAQVLARSMAKNIVDNNPQFDKDDVRKVQYKALTDARSITGAGKKRIGSDDLPLTDREWEAIQARAVGHTTLSEILANAHMPRIKELATPRTRSSLTPGQLARARQKAAAGLSVSEIARDLGLPRSTVADNLGR